MTSPSAVVLPLALAAPGISANERPNVIAIMAVAIGAEGLATYGCTIRSVSRPAGPARP